VVFEEVVEVVDISLQRSLMGNKSDTVQSFLTW
jgi:hypothetical protein